MNITTKLIDSAYIKANTVVQELVADITLDSFIYMSQDFWIKPILSEELYSNVINEVSANSGSTTGLTSTTTQILVDNIKPVLSYYTIFEALPFLSVKITSNGIIKRSGSAFEPIQVDELKFLRKDILDKAKSYETILRDYLEANKSLYFTTYDSNTKRSLGGFYF
jgi:hypothetical protein